MAEYEVLHLRCAIAANMLSYSFEKEDAAGENLSHDLGRYYYRLTNKLQSGSQRLLEPTRLGLQSPSFRQVDPGASDLSTATLSHLLPLSPPHFLFPALLLHLDL